MPIRPENLPLYPKDWPQIRARILVRAGHCCERCHVPNSITVFRRDSDGAWFDGETGDWRSPDDGRVVGDGTVSANNPHYLESIGKARAVAIVLTIMHLDFNPRHNDDVNLLAGCQQCHNRHDAADRARGRKDRARAERADGDLFQEVKA